MTTPDGVHPRLGAERGFVHKRLLGGISRIAGIIPIPGAGVVSRIASAFAGGGRTARPTIPRTQTARVTTFSAREKDLGRQLKFGGGSRQDFRGQEFRAVGGTQTARLVGASEVPDLGFCFPPWRPDPVTGECKIFVGDRPGGEGSTPVGDAVMGRYGAGLTPGFMELRRAVCLRGMQLGNDGLCYNKSQINNKQRMWPAGRKPLLTGGDMRAISTAARAGRRMDLATKRLQKMGMMKKPVRRIGPTRHQALLETHAGSKH